MLVDLDRVRERDFDLFFFFLLMLDDVSSLFLSFCFESFVLVDFEDFSFVCELARRVVAVAVDVDVAGDLDRV